MKSPDRLGRANRLGAADSFSRDSFKEKTSNLIAGICVVLDLPVHPSRTEVDKGETGGMTGGGSLLASRRGWVAGDGLHLAHPSGSHHGSEMPVLERKFILGPAARDRIRGWVENGLGPGGHVDLDEVIIAARPIEFRLRSKVKSAETILQYGVVLGGPGLGRVGVFQRVRFNDLGESRRTEGLTTLLGDGPKIDLREILGGSFPNDLVARLSRGRFRVLGIGGTFPGVATSSIYLFILFALELEMTELIALEPQLKARCIKDAFIGFEAAETSPVLETVCQNGGRLDAALAAALRDGMSSQTVSRSSRPSSPSMGIFRPLREADFHYKGLPLDHSQSHWRSEPGCFEDFDALASFGSGLGVLVEQGLVFDAIFADYLREAVFLLESGSFLAAQAFLGASAERLVDRLHESFRRAGRLVPPETLDPGNFLSVSRKLTELEENARWDALPRGLGQHRHVYVRWMRRLMRDRNKAAHPNDRLHRLSPSDLYEVLGTIQCVVFPYVLEIVSRVDLDFLVRYCRKNPRGADWQAFVLTVAAVVDRDEPWWNQPGFMAGYSREGVLDEASREGADVREALAVVLRVVHGEGVRIDRKDVVHALIVQQGVAGPEYLCQRNRRCPELFQLIGGGVQALDSGPEQALRREICEELSESLLTDADLELKFLWTGEEVARRPRTTVGADRSDGYQLELGVNLLRAYEFSVYGVKVSKAIKMGPNDRWIPRSALAANYFTGNSHYLARLEREGVLDAAERFAGIRL